MTREEAEQLMAGIGKVSTQLANLAEACEDISEGEVKRRVKESFAQAVDSIWFDLTAPICRQFPDLDPDKQTLGA